MEICVKYALPTSHLDHLGKKKSLTLSQNLAQALAQAAHLLLLAGFSSLPVWPGKAPGSLAVGARGCCQIWREVACRKQVSVVPGANCFSCLSPRSEALSYGPGVWLPAVQDRPHLQRGDALCQNPRCLQRAVHSLLPGTRQTKGAWQAPLQSQCAALGSCGQPGRHGDASSLAQPQWLMPWGDLVA